ncbi:hypothetical protein ACIBQ1_48885 [Nonomuraea sp. NPDC050153]|uniref:hypothetical protein n=1 Tax=Nonomuraea sp. NPDC050153 TaxID=3364359 RepID=UPI0037A04910
MKAFRKKAALALAVVVAGEVFLTSQVSGTAAADTADVVREEAEGRLGPGEWLLPGQSLTSQGGRFRLIQQKQGNLVFYDGTTALWTSPTSGNPGAKAAMQKEGNLVIYTSDNKPLWGTPTAGNRGAYLLLPESGGDLVLYSRDNEPLWSSRFYIGKLPSGHSLRAGQSVRSQNGRFKLVQQKEGNVVLYDMQGDQRALWTTPTAGKPGARSIMQSEGNFVVYDANLKPLWTTPTAGHAGAWLAVGNDGQVIIYSRDNQPLWSNRR